jgi:tol-pal system protein YbgF
MIQTLFPLARRTVIASAMGVLALCAGLAPAAHAQDAAEILLRLDRLENENRRLTGQIEEMRFQLRRTEDQLKRFQTDADTRFRDLEGNRAGARPVPAPQPQAAPPGNPPAPRDLAPPARRSDAFDPATNGAAPGAPRPLTPGGVATAPGMPLPGGTLPGGALPGGALPPGGRPVQDGDLGAPLDVTGRRSAPPLDPAPATNDPKSSFAFAKALADRGDYEQAEGEFKTFLRTYPRDRRVAEATFWLGETYLRRTRYREAAEHFLTVTSKYSTASRAPEAMLKLGISLRGLGANQEACGTFDQVTRKYPKASSAIRQAVEREKSRAKC